MNMHFMYDINNKYDYVHNHFAWHHILISRRINNFFRKLFPHKRVKMCAVFYNIKKLRMPTLYNPPWWVCMLRNGM